MALVEDRVALQNGSTRSDLNGFARSDLGAAVRAGSVLVQWAVHPAESPPGVLRAKPRNQVAQLRRERWAPWQRRLCPLLGDQVLESGRQGRRGDEPVPAQGAGQQPGEGGQRCLVGPVGPWRGDLATQGCDLVAQDRISAS